MWYTQVDNKVVELSFIVGEKYNIRICIFAADVLRHQWWINSMFGFHSVMPAIYNAQ